MFPALDRVLDTLISTKTALRLALLTVAQFCILRGVGYLPWFGPERIPTGVATITVFVPLWVFAFGWLAAGIIALASIPGVHPEGSAGAIVMGLIWAIGYTVSWIAAIQGVFIDSFPFKPYPFLPGAAGDWVVRVPFPALDTDGSPAARDYLTASQYWFVVLALGCGYVLARWALARRGSGGRERT